MKTREDPFVCSVCGGTFPQKAINPDDPEDYLEVCAACYAEWWRSLSEPRP